MKVEVETVYTAINNGFKEIQFYHDNCLRGLFVRYRKIPIISPGLIFAKKAFFAGLIFGGAYFWRGLLSEGILRFKMGLA